MRKIARCLTFAGLLLWSLPGAAEICELYDVPAATLLLPYFEVDLNNNTGIDTIFSVNNAVAAAALAHVTLWTDQSIPTLDFDVYLTGYDVETISVRNIFNGNLPVTADDIADPMDIISPQGSLSQDIDFPGSVGPCIAAYANPALSSFHVANLRAAHTGQFAPAYGGCLGFNYGNNIARGYITVDSVTQCNLLFPNSATYFSGGIADTRNILWGDYFYIFGDDIPAQGQTLVHIESCNTPPFDPANPADFIGFFGNGGRRPAGGSWCPFAPGEYTFYGRYASIAGQDQREPLPTTFATRFNTGSTELIVWRDSKTIPTGVNGPYSCGAVNRPAWFQLNQTDVVAFDEQENPEDLCFTDSVVTPLPSGVQTCFPLETQRVSLPSLNPTLSFGWIYLNLNTTVPGVTYPAADPAIAQAWVTTGLNSNGRFSVGYDAIKLDSACQPSNVVLIP